MSKCKHDKGIYPNGECENCGMFIEDIIKTLESNLKECEIVNSTAQAVLICLNIGDIKKDSPIHLKLREVMINYRKQIKEGE